MQAGGPDFAGDIDRAGEAELVRHEILRRGEAVGEVRVAQRFVDLLGIVVRPVGGAEPVEDRDVELFRRGGEVGVDGLLDGNDAARRERLAVAVVLQFDGVLDAFRDFRPAAEHPCHGIEENVARRVVRAFLESCAEEYTANAVGLGGDDRAVAKRRSGDVGDGLLVAGVDVGLRKVDEGFKCVVVSGDGGVACFLLGVNLMSGLADVFLQTIHGRGRLVTNHI